MVLSNKYRLTITYAGSETDVMYYDTLEDAEKAKYDIVTPFSNCSGTIEKLSFNDKERSFKMIRDRDSPQDTRLNFLNDERR